jgi:hypothetical protein
LELRDSDFSAKEFRREAFAAVAGVLSSGYLPVVVGSVIAAAPLIWSSLQIPCRGNGSCRTCIRVLESHAVHSEIRITFAPLPSSSMSLPLHSGEEDERHELQGRQGPRQAQLASRSLLPSN